MRIVVTGFRRWRNPRAVFELLDEWVEWPYGDRKNLVGFGDATGADAYAKAYCISRGIPFREFPANWSIGNKAGPIRNKFMIDTIRPDVVLAFLHPDSRGTQQCVQYAVEHGYKVIRVWP